MRACDLLAIKGDVDRGTVVFETKDDFEIIHVWSSIPTNANDLQSPMQSMVMDMPDNSRSHLDDILGVIALVISDRSRKVDAFNHYTYRYILEIKNGHNGIVTVDTGSQFIPYLDRVGQIEVYSYKFVDEMEGRKKFALELQANDEIFTTNPGIAGKRYIADGNKICLFMVNQLDFPDIIQLADDSEKQLSEIEGLKGQVALLKAGNNELLDKLAEADPVPKDLGSAKNIRRM